MEMVSTLCFGGQAAPEEQLVKDLLYTVFEEKQKTQDFSLMKAQAEYIPVIRSFLLQLLLEHK